MKRIERLELPATPPLTALTEAGNGARMNWQESDEPPMETWNGIEYVVCGGAVNENALILLDEKHRVIWSSPKTLEHLSQEVLVRCSDLTPFYRRITLEGTVFTVTLEPMEIQETKQC